MERILLVEDNISLSKLISLKISKELPFEVDIAHTYKEAQLFMRQYKYFVALLDLNLPDAPNGEIVDYVIEQNIPCIVVSSSVNKTFRKQILDKNIIDYVAKGGIEDIDYTISILDRLNKNRQHKVLIVDDSMVFRKAMQRMMKNLFFKVFAVGHGEEALSMLEQNPDIKIVLTDYAMPVMDGLELTKEIRKTHKKSDLSILAISSNDDDEISAMFLKSGATDFIKKPFSKEEFSCRINNAIEALENLETLTNHSKRDVLTGLYNRQYFLYKAQSYFLKSMEVEESFCLARIDIDNISKLKDSLGSEIVNNLIVHLSELLIFQLNEGDLVSHFGSEGFCVLLKNISNTSAQILLEGILHKMQVSPLILEDESDLNFTVCLGAVSQAEESLEATLDQADLLLYNAKNVGSNTLILE
ncbi:response regulator [Sulfurimonas sp. MAG313]|nr:response regulator [Sulfurimonas sp. MAG313]MDF1881538.1 response regulator [Sulfurimonas sp. MAG313]